MMNLVFGSARYANGQNTSIDCELMFEGQKIPCTAKADDPSTVAIWDAVTSGEFGTVLPYTPRPSSIPAVVSMRQARLALRRAGVLANVDAMMAQADEETTIEWEYATEVRRDHPMISDMGEAVGLDDAAIDALFIAAATIE